MFLARILSPPRRVGPSRNLPNCPMPPSKSAAGRSTDPADGPGMPASGDVPHQLDVAAGVKRKKLDNSRESSLLQETVIQPSISLLQSR